MPGAKAFCALRFSADAGRLADLIAPPYDVIESAERERLGSKSPHGIVNLTLPEGGEDPAEPGNRYERAGALMAEWRAQGVLVEDKEPSLTVIQEEFDSGGRLFRRTGVLAAVRLERYGEGDIYPHERTLSGPRADRLALVRATKANLSPVLLIVPDGSGEVRSALSEIAARNPRHDVQGPDAARRRVWLERDGDMIGRIESALAGLPAVIADGHHRYETALAYRDEILSAPQGGARAGAYPGQAARVLCHIVPIEDEGLVVLPCHRIVKPKRPTDAEKLVDALREAFKLEEVAREEALRYPSAPAEGDRQGFVVAVGSPANFFRAVLRDRAAMAARAPERAEEWRSLDVPCLHLLVIEDVLGVTPDDVADGGYVSYSKDAEDIVRSVESSGRIGLILRPTPAEGVFRAARAGERMPQKSTYFYPKVAAGFAMRLLEQRPPRRHGDTENDRRTTRNVAKGGACWQ